MTDISLRTYFEEIDGMIDGSRVEEAIAHLKHILGIYPKNLEAYRLLAKGLLEKNKHLDAADVFQRVLSSVPDDFISHVGMAVVREDEGNLDAAIWHMERAYEVQPSNGPVQEELRRLYGKRDGMEPGRLRLSRGALARMYEKGSLYPQAIAELRLALREDPDRLDLKVLLASSLWHTRQRAEAAETSAKLLEVLPFCREANRILAHVWDAEGHANESQNYRRRLEALDPYEAFADPTQNGTGALMVPSEQVQVPRLENVYGETATDAARPDWMEALGIQYDQGTAGSTPETQEWLNVMTPASNEPAYDQNNQEESDVPTSLPGTGWLEALRGEAPAGGTGTLRPPPAPAGSDVPDWMRSSVAEPTNDVSGSPDWLSGLSAPTDAPVNEPPTRAVVGGSDWLNDLFGEQGGTPAAAQPGAVGNEPPAPGDLPDWLSQSMPAEAEPVPTQSQADHSGMTGWLTALHDDSVPDNPAPTAQAAPADGDVPSWLSTTDAADAAPPTLSNDVPDWMKPAAPLAGASNEGDDLPAWLAKASTTEAATAASAQNDIPAWMTGTDELDATPAASEAPAWSGPIEAVEPDTSDIPAWMSIPAAAVEPAENKAPTWTPSSEPLEPASDDLPAWMTSAPAAEPAAENDIPSWLTGADEPTQEISLAAVNAYASARTSEAEPALEAGDVPDWLKASQAQDEPIEAGDIPAWLTGTDEPTQTIGSALPAASEGEPAQAGDVPDWLKAAQAEDEPIEQGDVPAWLKPADETTVEIPTASAWAAANEDTMVTRGKTEPMPAPEDDVPSWLSATDTPADGGEEEIPAWMSAAPAETVSYEASVSAPTLSEAEEPAPAAPTSDIPDWLSGVAEEPAVAESALTAAMTDEEKAAIMEQAEEEIPDWMATAGWIPRDPTIPLDSATNMMELEMALPGEGAEVVDENAEPEPAELPDWLKALKPPEEVKPAAKAAVSADTPDWLRAAMEGAVDEPADAEETAAVAEVPTSDAPAQKITAADLPEWLSNSTSDPGDTIMSFLKSKPKTGMLTPLPDVDMPAAETTPDDIPDWLKLTKEPEDTFVPAAPAVETPQAYAMEEPAASEWQAAEPVPAEESVPELQAAKVTAFEPATEAEPVDAEAPAAVDPNNMTADEALAWLESLAVQHGAAAEELVSGLPAVSEPAPATATPWNEVSEVVEMAAPAAVAEPDEPLAEADLPDWLSATTKVEDEAVVEPLAEADLPDWLSTTMKAEVEAAVEPLAEADLPDWLHAPAEAEDEAAAAPVMEEANLTEAIAEPEAVLAEATPADSLPDWLKGPETPVAVDDTPVALTRAELFAETPATTAEAPVSDFDSDAAAIAWLESLAAKHGAAAEELVSTPEERSEALPAWLRESTEAAQKEAVAAEATADLAEPVAETPVEELTISDELPEWLRETAAEDEPAAAPVEAMIEPVPELAPTKPLAARAETYEGILDDVVLSDIIAEEVEAEVVSEETTPEVVIAAAIEDEGPILDEVVVDAIIVEETALPVEAAASIAATDAETEVPASSMSDDETLAWLESLAVKNGADAEELVSAPETRSDVQPAWLREQIEDEPEAVADEVVAEPVAEAAPVSDTVAEVAEPMAEAEVEALVAAVPQDKPDWLKQVEAESDEYEATLEAPPVAEASMDDISEDAAMAWLESLAMKHGAAAEELVSQPAARSDEMPDWVKAQAETENAAIAQTEAEAEANVVVEPVATEPAAEAEKPDWLKQMEAESDAYEETAAPVNETPAIEPTAELETTELPAWLSTPVADEAELDVDIVSAWRPPAQLDPDPQPETIAQQAPEPEPAVAYEPEPEVVVPPEPEPEMPSWLTSQPVEAPPEPDWITASGAKALSTTKRAEPQHQPVAESVTPEPATAAKAPAEPKPRRAKKPATTRKRPTGVKPSRLRRSEAPEIVLSLAREQLVAEKVGEAVDVYSELIASNNLIGDIITDLEAATRKRPDQPELLRTLGDAYMRDNQLQRALDTYKQALKKL